MVRSRRYLRRNRIKSYNKGTDPEEGLGRSDKEGGRCSKDSSYVQEELIKLNKLIKEHQYEINKYNSDLFAIHCILHSIKSTGYNPTGAG